MQYVVNLFRAPHLHSNMFTTPYTPAQFEQVRKGQFPPASCRRGRDQQI